MFITHAYDKQERLIEVPSVGMKPKKIKSIFRKYANSVFYDDSANAFCRFEGNSVFAWDDSRGRFVDYFKYINRAVSPMRRR
ncbi:hypothetical protein [Chryseolinea lacunae]|uniref:KTSC domain-containing protein n=1 Tax=Chryseolinea lacunae TaxID=2801331 RepID=A0ABS1L271_9BACT|nr:hypothetical protein [Chryseolinea lacunae]MBL0745670.1 hypothetical protein [Chryseolinea lacunae]